MAFHPAYHANAPVGVKAPMSGGKVIATTKLLGRAYSQRGTTGATLGTYKNQSHAVESDMPKSRTLDG